MLKKLIEDLKQVLGESKDLLPGALVEPVAIVATCCYHALLAVLFLLAFFGAHVLVCWVAGWLLGFGGDGWMAGLFTGGVCFKYLLNKWGQLPVDRGTVIRDEKLGEEITGAKPE